MGKPTDVDLEAGYSFCAGSLHLRIRDRRIIFSDRMVSPGKPMPRFFIHIRSNGHSRSHDQFGLDFPDVETTRSEVERAAQDLKHIFIERDQDPRNYTIEVENDTGEVVFRLPFSEILSPPLPHPLATYTIVGRDGDWLIYCDDKFVGCFAQQSLAKALVWEMVEARCAKQEASQVLIEDELGCEKFLCRCFKEAPLGTLLSYTKSLKG
jgi:hypothetical protein